MFVKPKFWLIWHGKLNLIFSLNPQTKRINEKSRTAQERVKVWTLMRYITILYIGTYTHSSTSTLNKLPKLPPVVLHPFVYTYIYDKHSKRTLLSLRGIVCECNTMGVGWLAAKIVIRKTSIIRFVVTRNANFTLLIKIIGQTLNQSRFLCSQYTKTHKFTTLLRGKAKKKTQQTLYAPL